MSVNTWESYKVDVIREDTLLTIQDLTVSYNEVGKTGGITSPAGTIRLNAYVCDSKTARELLFIFTHELGHALGLSHNKSGDIMYDFISDVIDLSVNDKYSYDQNYLRY